MVPDNRIQETIKKTVQDLYGELEEYSFSDLVCDALHVATQLGHDPDRLLMRAKSHYDNERKHPENKPCK